MSTMEENKQKLVLSIIHFLQQEAEHSSADKRESIEVAVQCLESAFGIDYQHEISHNAEVVDLSTLLNRQAPQESVSDAEEYKTKGNDLMRNGMYQEAVEQYTRAITLNPTNAVYFCNRAAAHSRLENHDSAIADCEEAVKLDPKYAKAYGRLGIAYSSLSRYREARDAYQKALNIDPGNTMYEENLRLADERIRGNPLEGSDIPGEAENLDLSQFMNNPNLLNMASQMLSDPNVRNMMSGLLNMGNESTNPNIDTLFHMGQQLAQQMQMNNPAFVDNLRRQFSGEASSTSESTSTSTNTTADKKDEPPGSQKDGDASSK